MNRGAWQQDPWLQYLPRLHRKLATTEMESGLPGKLDDAFPLSSAAALPDCHHVQHLPHPAEAQC